MPDLSNSECPPDQLSETIEIAKSDAGKGVIRIDELLRTYPRDPRLHFLRGSLLAGLQKYDDARASIATAITIDPWYALARFQLGFLELTSGRAAAAEAIWKPLDDLPETNALRVFATGLGRLARDELAAAAELLKRGIGLNEENPVINTDMQLIIDQINQIGRDQTEDRNVSATHLLLRQYAAKRLND